ncbi:carbohydrate kinase [Chryseobacterium arthrosphaerae]|uniref:Carbohydrate kinase n=2 Tax=Chryseobacterium TaxID=59732 RepID=A0ABY4BEF3_9FLAO|nr:MULTISPECIES: carbohydrate kinase [Chryseobacterium]UEQ78130.1 carbohydrate kinase [Chryseobacterium arthrosphaerae]UOE37535.1 carbohydrate kinase [Chryseobacterium oryzae]
MFLNKKINAVSFGEVLFDVFGEEKKIGGAPLNLALRTASFGFPVAMISAVGNDEDGKVICDYVRENQLDTSGIITTEDYDTGIVQVTLNERGSATYEIKFPSAWDFIEINNDTLNIVKNADVFFYGSLVCRNDASRNTLFRLLDSNPGMFKVFDVNLRKPFYHIGLLEELMNIADFIKFNDEEILEIDAELGFKSDDLEENIRFISEKTNTKSICVTLGKHGSLLLWEDEIYRHGGYPVKVADTVGAGDSFLASLIAQLLSNRKPDKAMDFASAVGAIVASKAGANPIITSSDIDMFTGKTFS